MKTSELFWNASLEELKRGYVEKKEAYICLLCGEHVEKGVVYPLDDKLYEAERFMRIHIEHAHGSVFEYLAELDKKLTGLTDHQNRLLRLFYQGKNDEEVQKELGIGSASTIRNHRFVLKEKERQAKTFLAMMELLKEKDAHAPAFVPLHKTAKMVDDRYNITEEERKKVVAKFFPDGLEGGLTKFPPREKQRLIAVQEIAKAISDDMVYSEKELNEILKPIFADYAKVRRYLIEYGFLDRKADGSAYWRKK
ncbi:MAG: DUF2087 domain-containing protein [Bacillus sp. (in: firmicutes)]